MSLSHPSTNAPSSHRKHSTTEVPRSRRRCFTDSCRTRLNGFAESDWYLYALSEPPFYASTNTVKSGRSLSMHDKGPASSSPPSHQRIATTTVVIGSKFPSIFCSEGLMTAFLADSPASRAIFSDGLWLPLCAARGLAESRGQSLFELPPSAAAFFTRGYDTTRTVARHDEASSSGGTGFSCSAAVSISVAYQGTMLVGSLLRVWALSLERASQPLVVKALLAKVKRRLSRGNKYSRRKRSEEEHEGIDEKQQRQQHITSLLPYRSLHWRGCVLWCRYYCGLEVAESLKNRVEEDPHRRSASASRRSKSRKQRSEGEDKTQRGERRSRRHSSSPAPTRTDNTTHVIAASPSPQAVDHEHVTDSLYINSAATSMARAHTTTPAGSPAPVGALPTCSNGKIAAGSSGGEDEDENGDAERREKDGKGQPLPPRLLNRRSILKGDRHDDDDRAKRQRSQPRRVTKFADSLENKNDDPATSKKKGDSTKRKDKRKRRVEDKKALALDEGGLMTRCVRSLARGIFYVLTAPLRPLSTVTYIVLAELQWQPSFVDVLVRGVVMSVGLLLRDTIQLQLAATALAATTASSLSGVSTDLTTSSSLIRDGNSKSNGSVIVLSPLFTNNGLLSAGGSTKTTLTQSRERSDGADVSFSSDTSLPVILIGITPFALFVAVRTAGMLIVAHSPLSVASRRGLLNPLYQATTITTATVDNEAVINIDNHNATKKLIDEADGNTNLRGSRPATIKTTTTTTTISSKGLGGRPDEAKRRAPAAKIILSPTVIKVLRFVIGTASHPIGHLGILHFVAAVRLSSTPSVVVDATSSTNAAASSSSSQHTISPNRLYLTDLAKALTLLLASASFRSVLIPFVEHHSRVAILNALVYSESVLWHRYTDAVRRLKWGISGEDGVGGGASLMQGSRASRSTSYFLGDARQDNKNAKKRREDPTNNKSAVAGSSSTRSFMYTSLNNSVSLSSRRRTNPAVVSHSVPTTPRGGGVQRRGGEEGKSNTTFVNTTVVGDDKIHHRNKIAPVANTNKSIINASAFSVRSLATTAAYFASPQCSASSLVEKVVVRRQRMLAEVAKVSNRVSRLSEQLEEYNRVSVAMLGVPLAALTCAQALPDFLNTYNNNIAISSENGDGIATIGASKSPKAIRQGSANGRSDYHDHEQPNKPSTRDHQVNTDGEDDAGLSQHYHSPPPRRGVQMTDVSAPLADPRLLPPSPLATVIINKSGPLSTRSTSVVAIGGAQSVLLVEEGEANEAEGHTVGLEFGMALGEEYGRVAFNKAPLFLPPLPPLVPQNNRNKPPTSLSNACAGSPSHEPSSQLYTPRGARSRGGDTSSEYINTTAAPPQPFAPTPPPHQHGKVIENTDRDGHGDIFEHLNDEDENGTANQKHEESNDNNLVAEALMSETARPEHHLAHARDNTLPMIPNAAASTPPPHTALGETHTVPTTAAAAEHEPSMGRIDLEDVSHIAALSEAEGDVSAMLNTTFDFNLLPSKRGEDEHQENETKTDRVYSPHALAPSSALFEVVTQPDNNVSKPSGQRAPTSGRVTGETNRQNRRAVKLVDLDGTIHVPNNDVHQSINVREQKEATKNATTSPALASAASSSNKRSSARQSSRNKKVRKSAFTSTLRRLLIGAPSRLIAASLKTTRALANFLFFTAPFTHDEAPTVMEAVVATLLCTHTARRDSFAALIDTPLLLARTSFAASYHLRASNSRMLRCRLTTTNNAINSAASGTTTVPLHNNEDKGGTDLRRQENTAAVHAADTQGRAKLTQYPCGYLPLCFLFEHEAALGVHLLTRRCFPKEPLFPALGGVFVSEQRQKEGGGGRKGVTKGEVGRTHEISSAAPTEGSADTPTESLARWMPSLSEGGGKEGVRDRHHEHRDGIEERSPSGEVGKEEKVTTITTCKPSASAEISLPFTVTEANLKFISSHPKRFLTSAADDDANVLLHCQPCGVDEMAEEADVFDTALVDFLFSREVTLTAAKARREERAKLKDRDDGEAERTETERNMNEDQQIYSIQCRQLVSMAQRVETVIRQLKEDEALLSRRVQFYTAIAGGLSRRLVVRTVWFQSFARSIADILVRFPLETLAMLVETRALHYLLLARYRDFYCSNNSGGGGCGVNNASSMSFLLDCFNFIQSEWEVLVCVLRGWGEGSIQGQLGAMSSAPLTGSESDLVTSTIAATSHAYEGDPLLNPVIPGPLRGSAWGGVYLDARSRFILATPLYCGVLPYALFFGSSRMLSTWGDVTS